MFRLKTKDNKEMETGMILDFIQDLAENQLKDTKKMLELSILMCRQSELMAKLSKEVKELRDEIQNKNSNQNRV